MKRNNLSRLIALIVIVAAGLGLGMAVGQNGAKISSISLVLLCCVIAFLVNWAAFIPANAAKTERFYDLVGSLTYLSVIAVAISLTPKLDARAIIAAVMVAVWAIRLGSFLFKRVHAQGKDDRFDEIKLDPLRFFLAWTLQGLWVIFTLACALAIITSDNKLPIGLIGAVGIATWLVGFIIEVVADAQKNAFRHNPDNAGKFINSGLWSWSRHPNYFGEMVLWSGMAILAVPILSGWQWLALISPVFIYLLLTRVSGIPMLAEKAEKRWGQEPEFQEYLRSTSRLIPLPPAK